MKVIKERLIRWLRWSERYTKTDMVYFASGNFWLVTSRVVAVGSGMLLTVAFANLVSPQVFGTYKYVLAIAGIIGAFALNGLGTAITKSVAQGNKGVIRPLFWLSVKWSLPASAAAAVGSAYYFFRGNTDLGTGLLLIAFTNPFLNTFVFSKALLAATGDFKGLALYNLPRSLVPVAAIVTAILFADSVFSLLLAYFGSNLLIAWYIYEKSLARHGIDHQRANEETRAKIRETVTYGKHLSVLGILMQVVGYIDQLLLWFFAGPVQLATYSFTQAPIRELRNFTENSFPLIFPKFAQKTISEIKKTLPLRALQLTIASVAFATAYIAVAPYLFKLLFPQYMSSVFASQLLAGTLVFQAKGLIETLIIAHGEVKKRYIASVSSNIIRIALFTILIPAHGYMGAVYAIVIAEAISSAIYYAVYKSM